MGGSSVPSNTTQTTLLDPVRQKGLQDAAGYFNKWASTYNGPTYKGPLVAGRTQDWYTAQDMAHKMANRFASGGITSVRRFDSGGDTSAQPWWSGYNDAQDAQDAGVTQPVDNTYAPSSQANLEASAQNAGYQGFLGDTAAMQEYLNSQNASVQDYTGNYAANNPAPTDGPYVIPNAGAPVNPNNYVPTNDWGDPYQISAPSANVQSLSPYDTMDATGWTAEPPAPKAKSDAELLATNWTSADIDSGAITPAELSRLRDLNTQTINANAAKNPQPQRLGIQDTPAELTGLASLKDTQDAGVTQPVDYTYAPSSQQQLENQAVNAGYQGDYTDTAAMQGYLNSIASIAGTDTLSGGLTKDIADTGLASLKDSISGGLTKDTLSGGLTKDIADTGLASLKDSISGGAAKDTLSGGAAKDTLSGGAAKDTLSGGAAKDTLSGGAAKDTISGGAAKDTLSGGAAKDTIATPVYTAPTYTATPTTTNTQSPYLIAQGLAQKGIGGIYGITDKNLTPQQLSNSYTNPDQITPGTITPDMWNATAMATYMSPYTKGVVDIALREADRQRAIERLRENTAATQSGAFGGYRQGVVEAEGERNYNQRLGDIVNTGYQNAYNNAQTQFNADRASSVGAQTTNQANALQAYQNNQAALQQAAILDAQAGQNNINNARQSVIDQLNALNMGISGASQLPAIETAYQQGSGVAQNALTTADASARSAMQAYYDAIAKLSDANGNINLQKAQNLSNIMFGNNIPSGVQATVKT